MIEKKRKEKEEEAKKNIKELAGEDKNEAVEVICIGIDFLITGKIAGVEVVTKDGCKLSAKINSKNTIKTEMTKIMKKSKEA